MQETPENTTPDVPESIPQPAPLPAPVSSFRTLLIGALLGGSVVFAVLSVLAWLSAPPVPVPAKSSKVSPPVVIVAPPAAAIVAPKPLETPATLSAAESVSVSGSVADEFGRAIVDATVFVGQDLPEPSAPSERLPVGELGVTNGPVPVIPTSIEATPPKDAIGAHTDQDGKFAVTGVKPGAIQIFVTQVGYEPNLVVLDAAKAGDVLDQVYIVLRTPAQVALETEEADAADQKLARIAGIVLDKLGHPVPNVRVRTDEGDAKARTNASGEFSLTGVAPGALRILAEDESAGSGQSAVVRARAGETLEDVRVHLPGRHTLTDAENEALTSSAAAPRPSVMKRAAPVMVGGLALEDRPTGVFVNMIDKSNAAAQAGLGVGDVLVRVDDEAVLSAAQARGMLRDPPGELAKVQVLRGTKRVTLRWKRPAGRFSTDATP